MDCKFASNGIAIDYFGVVRPCCVFRPDQDYKDSNHISKVNLMTWHQSTAIAGIRDQLAQDKWPKECSICEDYERQGRGDSMRLNGESAYGKFDNDNIHLELRAGSVCNFACQTCWPQASSRVAQFYRQSGRSFIPAMAGDWDLEYLSVIQDRLKSVQVLGGEPFYDQRCRQFFDWLRRKNLSPALTIFTNGSVIDQDFIENYPGPMTLVFSLDAVGRPAEYIRYGTHWPTIESNFLYYRQLKDLDFRVNVTTSPYNYWYLPDLIDWMTPRWPNIVSWNPAHYSLPTPFMNESVFPLESRSAMVKRLELAVTKLKVLDIEEMQKINAVNSMESIINNLQTLPYDPRHNKEILAFIKEMDSVKGIRISDYCQDIVGYFDINDVRLA